MMELIQPEAARPLAAPIAPSSLFLIGPMGSGKTAVGRVLARLRRQRFMDSDAEIERRTGVDIPFIFDREGEAGFRVRERDVIDDLTQWPGIVLATGGGAVLNEANRARLSNRGTVIYLQASISQLVERTQNSRHRPLLQGTDPAVRLAELMAVREPLYRSIADLVIPTDRRKVQSVAEAIVEGLKTLQDVSPASGIGPCDSFAIVSS